ncbi:hypothetical protein ACLKMY_38530, partial [Paraburkholderia mimosarum]|uniref:hypothetical protein n=1 Tax=Paraburkholderia mimosarum TaxID=312026 RepID=UPI0039C2247C
SANDDVAMMEATMPVSAFVFIRVSKRWNGTTTYELHYCCRELNLRCHPGWRVKDKENYGQPVFAVSH